MPNRTPANKRRKTNRHRYLDITAINTLRNIEVELRFHNIIKLYETGIYTDKEFENQCNIYFNWIEKIRDD